MIVMKFGGTSVADAERIGAVAAIVRDRSAARPVVVVSALAKVTDLLVRAIDAARRDDREALEPVLAEIARRHRWGLDAVPGGGARHDLGLEIDAALEELRQLLRSVRILGEGTPRASDALLAFGEHLSSKIVAEAIAATGTRTRWIDARQVVATDGVFGRAEPDFDRTAERARRTIAPLVDEGIVPVLGGFVGASPDDRTTTLGRGGSDTSAALLGAVLGAEEIQIWTDVDGILSADPRVVPEARTREAISFAEAAELAYYGAKVLHPASIAPAVRRKIPVRVLNSLRPSHDGTVILEESGPSAPQIASVASRGGCCAMRVSSRTMRMDPGFLPAVLDAVDALAWVPDLVVSSEVAVSLAVPGSSDPAALERALGGRATVRAIPELAVVCVIGSGIARDAAVRGRVIAALGAFEPVLLAAGGSATSVGALYPESRLAEIVRGLHRTFLAEESR